MEENNIQEQEQEQAEAQENVTLNFGQDNSASTPDNAEPEQVTLEDGLDYTQDKRWKDHWGEDVNKIYASNQYYQKQAGQYQNQYSEAQKDMENLKGQNEDAQVIYDYINSPEGSEVLKLLQHQANQNLNTNQNQQQQVQNDPNDPNSALINRLATLENDMGQWNQQATAYHQQVEQEKALKPIDDFATQNNIQWDKQQFQNYMAERNIAPEHWGVFFRDQASPHLLKRAQNSAAQSAVQRNNAVPGMGVPAGKVSNSLGNMSFGDRIASVLN